MYQSNGNKLEQGLQIIYIRFAARKVQRLKRGYTGKEILNTDRQIFVSPAAEV